MLYDLTTMFNAFRTWFVYVWEQLYEKPIFTLGNVAITVGGIMVMSFIIGIVMIFLQRR